MFTAGTCHAMYTEMTHPHSISFPLVRRKFHSDSFFSRNVMQWNKRMLPWSLQKLNLFKYSQLLSILHNFIIFFYSLLVHSYKNLSNFLPWVTLKPCIWWIIVKNKKCSLVQTNLGMIMTPLILESLLHWIFSHSCFCWNTSGFSFFMFKNAKQPFLGALLRNMCNSLMKTLNCFCIGCPFHFLVCHIAFSAVALQFRIVLIHSQTVILRRQTLCLAST